jgi:uncharacterized lipoprotein YehR (DUF1307 family)
MYGTFINEHKCEGDVEMKKFMTVIVMICLVFALAACGNKSDSKMMDKSTDSKMMDKKN